MSPEDVLATSDIFRTYYTPEEFLELARLFNFELNQAFPDERPSSWLPVAKELYASKNHSDVQSFLETALKGAQRRSAEMSSGTMQYQDDKRIHHDSLWAKIESLLGTLGESGIPGEMSVDEGHEFSAKSEVREFFQSADTEILVVDGYAGVGTLDCFRDVSVAFRLLTGQNAQSIESGFQRALDDFRGEDGKIEVRTHAKVHDRHAVFNERCWLIGSSLKHAGRKRFNVIEMGDVAPVVIPFLNKQWDEGSKFPP